MVHHFTKDLSTTPPGRSYSFHGRTEDSWATHPPPKSKVPRTAPRKQPVAKMPSELVPLHAHTRDVCTSPACVCRYLICHSLGLMVYKSCTSSAKLNGRILVCFSVTLLAVACRNPNSVCLLDSSLSQTTSEAQPVTQSRPNLLAKGIYCSDNPTVQNFWV